MAPTDTHNCRPTIRHTRPSASVTAEIVLDLRGATHEQAIARCWLIAECPPGAVVRVRVDDNPVEILRDMLGQRVREWNPGVRLVVEAPDAGTARRWLAALRGEGQ